MKHFMLHTVLLVLLFVPHVCSRWAVVGVDNMYFVAWLPYVSRHFYFKISLSSFDFGYNELTSVLTNLAETRVECFCLGKCCE